MSHQPIQNFVALFWVTGKTPGLISHNNLGKKNFVCIGRRDNVLARSDSTFPLLRCQEVWNKTCTQLSLSHVLFRIQRTTVFGVFKDSAFIFYSIRRSFFTKSATAAMFTAVRVNFGRPHLSSSSTSFIRSRNREYHLKTFDRFTASFP
jgi:hypothetical protein